MAERNRTEGEKPPGKRALIRETIEEKTPRGKRRVRLLLLVSCLAVVVGLIASLTFVLTTPWLTRVFGAKEPTRESVMIPKDSVTEPETAAESTEPGRLEEAVESAVAGYMETFHAAQEEERELLCIEQVSDISNDLRSSMVTVTSQRAEEDVFQHQYIRSQETYGLVLAVTGQEILILTEPYLLEEEDTSVHITLPNGSGYEADIVGMDRTTRIAVVSIPIASVEESSLNALEPAELGNSYLCRAGDLAVALGNPMGYVPSVSWGIISYVEEGKQGTDANFHLIQTDIAGNEDATGILVNASGEVIGWITQEYNTEEMKNLLAAISISDIKDFIERISNGERMACLGVQVQSVTPAIAQEKKMPRGLYITKSLSDGAASEAGLQNGDILTELDGKELKELGDLQSALMEAEPDETVEVTVMRSGRSGYAEQSFEVRLTAR